jgi:SAM-dependent methyltransferase
MNSPYTHEYFSNFGHWCAGYRKMAQWLNESLQFNTVLDLGCGPALLITELYCHGKEILGVDKSPCCLDFIPKRILQFVQIQDLTGPVQLGTFDLVICTEVAEHLPAWSADQLIETIDRHCAKWLYFSAAVPGQGGVDHINERPHEYWIEKLASRGIGLARDKTLAFREYLVANTAIPWFQNNSLILKR